jgi:hypothetical protein
MQSKVYSAVIEQSAQRAVELARVMAYTEHSARVLMRQVLRGTAHGAQWRVRGEQLRVVVAQSVPAGAASAQI